MNPIQAIDELIEQKKHAEGQAHGKYELLRIEDNIRSLEHVRNMLIDAGHDEPETVDWRTISNDSRFVGDEK